MRYSYDATACPDVSPTVSTCFGQGDLFEGTEVHGREEGGWLRLDQAPGLPIMSCWLCVVEEIQYLL